MNHSNGAVEAARNERFTNGKRRVVTEDDLRSRWGLNSDKLRCYMCGHEFALGEYWRWQYMNDTSPSYGNFNVCDACDGPDVKDRWLAAGKLAYAPHMDEMILAVRLLESSTQVSELRRVLKLANDFIVNGVEYQAGHYEAETVHHEIWAVLEGKG